MTTQNANDRSIVQIGAAFIATSLFHPDLNRTDVELTAGDTPIDKAVAALAPRPWRP